MAARDSLGIPASSAPAASQKRLTVFLFGLAVVHGLALNLMPVLFPTIGEVFRLSKALQGLLQTSFTAGMIVSSVLAGYLINYLGARKVAVVVVSLTGLGALLFGLAGFYELVLCAAMMMGMGVAALNVVYAAVITARFADVSQRMYMLTFAVLAASATVSTVAIGALINRYGYGTVFTGFAFLIWFCLAALLVMAGGSLSRDIGRARIGEQEEKADSHDAVQAPAGVFRFLAAGVFNRPALYVLGLLVILDTLASGNLLAWAPTYFNESFGLANAGLVLSASSFGVCLGRLALAGLPPGFISDRLLLGLCYAGSMIAFGLILLLRPGLPVSLFLIGLSGAFVSAQAPTTYSIATSRFGERAPAAIPFIDAMGNLGSLAGAPLLGILADRAGNLGATMWLIPISGFALVAVVLTWEIIDCVRLRNRRRIELRTTAAPGVCE